MEYFLPPALNLKHANSVDRDFSVDAPLISNESKLTDAESVLVNPFQLSQQTADGTCQFTCLKDIIESDSRLFYFMCLSGIVVPSVSPSGWTARVALLRIWVVLLYLSTFVYTLIVSTLYIRQDSSGAGSSSMRPTYDSFKCISVSLESILIIFMIWRIRRTLSVPMYDVATLIRLRESYLLFITYAWFFIITFVILSGIKFAIQISQFANDVGFVINLFFVNLLSYVLPTFFAMGILVTIMICLEQCKDSIRVSLLKVTEMNFEFREYQSINEHIRTRERSVPISLFILQALLHVMTIIVFICTVGSEISGVYWISVTCGTLALLQQALVCVYLFYHIAQLNGLGDQIAYSMTEFDWPEETSVALVARQLKVLGAALKHPLGIEIMHYRPNKTEMFLSIASIILGLVVSIVVRLLTEPLFS